MKLLAHNFEYLVFGSFIDTSIFVVMVLVGLYLSQRYWAILFEEKKYL